MVESRQANCLFCSLACRMTVQVERDLPVGLEYVEGHPVNGSNLCSRGILAYEVLDHPYRLDFPLYRRGRDLVETTWADAERGFVARLNEVKMKHGADSVALILGPCSTHEEVDAAWGWAQKLGTRQVGIQLADGDGELIRAERCDVQGSTVATLEDLEGADLVIAIGDVLISHPILAKRVLNAKYRDKANRLVVIDPSHCNTAWFADYHLRNIPGTEPLVIAGLVGEGPLSLSPPAVYEGTGVPENALASVRQTLRSAQKAVIVYNSTIAKTGDPELLSLEVRHLSAQHRDRVRYLPLYNGGASFGLARSAAARGARTVPQIIEAIKAGGIRTLIVVGEDLLSSYPSPFIGGALDNLDLLTVCDLLPNATTQKAHYVLPVSLWLETEGTVNSWNGREEHWEPVLPPPSGARQIRHLFAGWSGTSAPAPVQGSTPLISFEVEQVKARLNAMLEAKRAAREPNREFPYLLYGHHDSFHFGNGYITRQVHWTMFNAPDPVLTIHPKDAGAIGLGTGDRVVVTSKVGEAEIACEVTERVSPTFVSAPIHFPEVRGIFSSEMNADTGLIVMEPQPVRLAKG
jgi:anaerobic selenocysteine-containing dehydrogenase